jgi:hypothetical protein
MRRRTSLILVSVFIVCSAFSYWLLLYLNREWLNWARMEPGRRNTRVHYIWRDKPCRLTDKWEEF